MRVVGVISLFAVALVICRALAEHEERRIRAIDGLLALLRHVKAKILCFRMPLDEIYRDVCDAELERIGFLRILRESASLRRALEGSSETLLISQDLFRRLAELGDALGAGDGAAAAELCEYYIGELSREAAELRAAAPKRLRLHRSLVVTGMLMLVIVFI